MDFRKVFILKEEGKGREGKSRERKSNMFFSICRVVGS